MCKGGKRMERKTSNSIALEGAFMAAMLTILGILFSNPYWWCYVYVVEFGYIVATLQLRYLEDINARLERGK
jgi:hypothetical protein